MNRKVNYKLTEEKKRYTFLVVDDEPDVVEIIHDTLKKHYKDSFIFTATDGHQALGKFRNATPSLLITDLSMPKVSGNELLTHILQSPKTNDMQVIVISGLSRDDRYISEVLNGRFRFLPKPFRANELVNLVEYMLKNPYKSDRKFKVDVPFLNAFLSGGVDAFQNTHDITLSRTQPFVRQKDYKSGDYSYSFQFSTSEFTGMISVCFTTEAALRYQETVGQDAGSVDEDLLEVIAHEIGKETEENLLKIGYTVKLDPPIKNSEPGHLIETNISGSTIVLPLCSEQNDWQVKLELSVG